MLLQNGVIGEISITNPNVKISSTQLKTINYFREIRIFDKTFF